jgi:hypothetical protein
MTTPTILAPTLFDQSVLAIKGENERLKHPLSWRFRMGPRATLTTAEIGFFTLNPGGKGIAKDQPCESSESGNAYWTEAWTDGGPGAAPLQRQVQRLFGALATELGEKCSVQEFVDTKAMSAYFMENDLSNQGAALHSYDWSSDVSRACWTLGRSGGRASGKWANFSDGMGQRGRRITTTHGAT